jgi:putative tricarboxylic transport membrane protein
MIIIDILRPGILIPWIFSMAIGVIVGGTPGLTATMAVALIVPLTYYMEPLAGLAMILGVSFSSIFTGDIPATFLRIPGTPASGAAILDGYEMAKKGEGSLALIIDLFCSVIGGLIGVLLLIIVAPPLANFALKFSNFQYFWLGVFGLSMSAVICKGNNIRGIISAVLGILVSTVGVDITTGFPRFTFGYTELMGGIGFIPAMIGLFGISEVLKNVKSSESLKAKSVNIRGNVSILKTLLIIWKHKWTLIKSAFIGTGIGALPGAGADIAAWVAYGMAKKTSRKPEEFGKGSIDGIVAPTSANNAALGGTWIPALVFGVPGDSITAIVLGAMLMYGLRPGPLIFQQSPDLVKGLFAVALLSQLFLIPIGLIGIKAFSYFLSLPRNVILVIVLIFSLVGSYSIRNSYFDIYVMLFFGVVGFIFENLNIPLPPMILGIILGPMIEDNLRVGLIKTGGNYLPFIMNPISAVLVILIIFTFSSNYFDKIFNVILRKNGNK